MSWLPMLMKLAGLSLQAAILSTVLLNGGGAVGAALQGKFIDRFGAFNILAANYILGALVVLAPGAADKSDRAHTRTFYFRHLRDGSPDCDVCCCCNRLPHGHSRNRCRHNDRYRPDRIDYRTNGRRRYGSSGMVDSRDLRNGFGSNLPGIVEYLSGGPRAEKLRHDRCKIKRMGYQAAD